MLKPLRALHFSAAHSQNGKAFYKWQEIQQGLKEAPKLTPKRGNISANRRAATTDAIIINTLPAPSPTTASSSGLGCPYPANEIADIFLQQLPQLLLIDHLRRLCDLVKQ